MSGPKMEKQAVLRKCCGNFLLLFRWILIAIGFWFVTGGWFKSINKYLSGKTSVSFLINETDTFMYPSITICPGYKAPLYDRVFSHYNSLLDNGVNTVSNEDMEVIFSNISYERNDFLQLFMHDDVDISRIDSRWITSTPIFAYNIGKCFTYNPRKVSTAGRSAGISLGVNFRIKYPEDLKDSFSKKRWLTSATIYLHDRDKFFPSGGQDMPSGTRIDMSKLKFGQENELIVSYSRFTSLDKPGHSCSSDESESFMRCFEESMSKHRGCQKPWFYFPEFGIRKCDHVSDFLREDEYHQYFMSVAERANVSGCRPPCTKSIYQLEFAYSEDYNKDDAYVSLYFKDFRFQYSEEYLICDITCLIGKIGGNFGFFLGGSILTLYDIFYFSIRTKLLI